MRPWRLLAVVSLIALWSVAAPADERILDFHSDIRVSDDASLEVRETIRVQSQGERIVHGIFRDFPTHYTDRLGRSYDVDFTVEQVRRDEAPENYTQEQMQNGVRIKMGDASAYLPRGEHTYGLTYRVTRELGFFPDHDELYWNVTGNGWQFPIDSASATVSLPGRVQPSDLRLAGYTGPEGSRAHDLRHFTLGESTVSFATTSALGEHEGLTIVVGFPKGLVTEPTRVERLQWFLADDTHWLVGLAGLVIVLLYYLSAWSAVGRDPRRGTIVVAYEPPNVSPAAMAFMQNMGYDNRAFVSAVVDLAIKRYLTIEQAGSGYRLKRLKPGGAGLPEEESNLLHNLFADKAEIDISETQASTIDKSKIALTEDLDVEEDETFFNRNRNRMWPGIVMTLVTFVLMVLNAPPGPAESVFPAAFLLVWLSVWTCAMVGIAQGSSVSGAPKKHGKFWTLALFGLFELFSLLALAALVDVWFMLVVLALLGTNVAFFYLLPALTPAGRALLDKIEGFKQYLMEVESDRLQRMDAPPKTASLFEKCLPYALALGVEQAWARQFEGVLARAAAATGGRGDAYSPVWLSGGDWSSFDAGRFATSFSADFSSAISSATTPPGSSSGSDGGSSGGGGGGGGGGGW